MLHKLAQLFDVTLTELTEDKKSELISIYDNLTTTRQENVLSYTKAQQEEQLQHSDTQQLRDLFPYQVYEKLSAGLTAIDAVLQAVIDLEDNILFNAGKGSVFTKTGKHEMDASIF